MIIVDTVISTSDGTISGVHVLLQKSGDEYVLTWSDTEVWAERFAELSIALVRLGALVKCVESDFELGFDETEGEFVDVTNDFFGKILS